MQFAGSCTARRVHRTLCRRQWCREFCLAEILPARLLYTVIWNLHDCIMNRLFSSRVKSSCYITTLWSWSKDQIAIIHSEHTEKKENSSVLAISGTFGHRASTLHESSQSFLSYCLNVSTTTRLMFLSPHVALHNNQLSFLSSSNSLELYLETNSLI